MRVPISALTLVLSTLAMASFAAEPSSPAGGNPDSFAQAPPEATPAATASTAKPAQAPAASTPAPAQPTADMAKVAHMLGYSPRLRSGKTVYCKPDTELGTRLQHLSCYTGEEMTAVVHRSIANQESVAKMQRTELYEENKH